MPKMLPEGLTGKWTFDDSYTIDTSGQSNHAKGSVGVGSGVGYTGASALFSGTDYLMVPHSKSFESSTYSITFWINVQRTPRTSECVLVLKGQPNTADPAPRLSYSFTTQKLHLESSGGVDVVSKAALRGAKWMHIAVVRTESEISLFVNGVMDVHKTVPVGKPNKAPFYIGGAPSVSCDYSALFDEVRYYQRALVDVEIAAEASPALGGVRPSFSHLGCDNCTLNNAKNSCRELYHVCTAMELYTGAFSVARINGYADWRTNIWTASDLATNEKEKIERKQKEAKAVDRATKHVVPNPATGGDPKKASVGVAMCCSDVL